MISHRTSRSTAPAPRPTTAQDRLLARRRPAQVIIWVLLVLVAVTGLTNAGAVGSLSPAPAPVVVTAGAAEVETIDPAKLSAPELARYAVVTDDSGQALSNVNGPMELLPAYRWRDDVDLVSDLGWRDIDEKGASMFGGLLFSTASFLWGVLLVLMRYGLTLDLVAQAAVNINTGFSNLAAAVGNSGLLAIAAAFVLLTGIAAFFRGNLPKVVAMLLMFALPLGAMQTLATYANAGTAAADGATVPKLSPAGLAILGNKTVNDLGVNLATGFGTTNKLADETRKAQLTGGPTSPNCGHYVGRLYATYAAAAAKDGTPGVNGSLWASTNGDLTPEEVQDQLSANSGVTTVSYLWEKAFLSSWTTAQFGSFAEGSLMACHQLELNNATPASEQFIIAAGDSKQSGGDTSIEKGPYIGFSQGPFTPITRKKDGQAAMFAWAACAEANGAKARRGWVDTKKIEENKDNKSPDCVAWKEWNGDGADADSLYDTIKDWGLGGQGLQERGHNVLEWKDPGDLAATTTGTGNADATQIEALQNVQKTVLAYWGHNPGQRLLWGLVALLTSCMYLWALGALALGAIIAQIGLVVMLVVLPVTLLLFALPGKGPGGRHPAGMRLMRLTGGFLAAKLVLIFSLTLLIQLIAILEDLLGGDGSGIWSALIPLAALLALRALLKSVGFGDITKLGGALAMSGAGGAMMAGDKKFAGAFGKMVDPGAAAKGISDRGRKFSRWHNNSLSGRASKALLAGAGSAALKGARGAGKTGKNLGGFAADEAKRRRAAKIAEAVAGGDTAALRKYNRQQARRDAAGRIAGEVFGYRDPVTGQRLSAGVMTRLGSLSGLAAATGLAGKDGALARFATHNKAAASRAGVLAEQHQLARALHAKRAGIADPLERREATAAFWAAQGELLGQTTQGGRRLPGQGLGLNAAEVELEKGRFANLAGCDTDMVISSQAGLPSLVATTHAKGRVIAKLSTDEATIENAKSLLNYLPKEWTERRMGESDEHYHSRMTLSMRAMGGMTVEGELTDTLAAYGIDTATVEGRTEVLKAARGEPSRLSKVQVDIPADVRKQIEDSLKISGVAFHAPQGGQALIDVRAEHASDLADFARAQVAELRSSLQDMTAAVAKIGSAQDDTASRAAATQLAKTAERIIGDSIREIAAATTEISGLTMLNNNPGKEQDALRNVSNALSRLEVAVDDQLSDVTKLTGGLLSADLEDRSRIAQALLGRVEQMVSDVDERVSTRMQEMAESQMNAHQAYERAKSMQLQKQLRGKSFAPMSAEMPA